MSNRVIYIYALVLLICFSRGVFELWGAKLLGYVVQLSALSLILAMLIKNVLLRSVIGRKALPIAILGLISVLLSIALTLTLFYGENTFEQAFVVLIPNLINICFLITALEISVNYRELELSPRFGKTFSRMVVVISLYVSTLTLLQFAGVLEFAGESGFMEMVRLSGPLGSIQHLSLVMAILCLLLLSVAIRSPSVTTVAALLISTFVLIVCYTRIGYFVVIVTLLILAGLNAKQSLSFIISKRGIACLLLTTMIGWTAVTYFSSEMETFYLRLSTISLEDNSNLSRLNQWKTGIRFFMDETTPLISSRMGSASQIPRQILGIESSHFESGQIQYLVNFGLLPALLINSVFVAWFFAARNSGVTAGLPVALMLALFIYMFNEIVPVFVLLPVIALEQKLASRYIHGRAMRRTALRSKYGRIPLYRPATL